MLATDPHPLTLELLEDACRRLSILSEARAQSIDQDRISTGRAETKAPPRMDDLVNWAQEEFYACGTDAERLEHIKEVQDVWSAVKWGPPAEQRRGTVQWKRAVAIHGLHVQPAVDINGKALEPTRIWTVPVRAVAVIYRVSKSEVHRLRRALVAGDLNLKNGEI